VAAHGLRAPPQNEQAKALTLAPATDELVHTTSEQPWLTADRVWVSAGELHADEQVIGLDGHTATITTVRVVSGAAAMYNLQVNQLHTFAHTFAVGNGQYVVHNRCDSRALGRAIDAQVGEQAHHVIPCSCQSTSLMKQAK
jgi:pretoxin HINT domain-containing protein